MYIYPPPPPFLIGFTQFTKMTPGDLSNTEFRINTENFHPCFKIHISKCRKNQKYGMLGLPVSDACASVKVLSTKDNWVKTILLNWFPFSQTTCLIFWLIKEIIHYVT